MSAHLHVFLFFVHGRVKVKGVDIRFFPRSVLRQDEAEAHVGAGLASDQ